MNLYTDLVKRSVLGKIYPDKTGYKHPHNFPQFAHTMIDEKRLDNIEYCIEEILKNNIPGDLIETGVWRGGACIFMAAVLKAHNVKRNIYVADSFEGLPMPNPKYPKDEGDNNYTWKELLVPLEEVKENFVAYGLLDDNIHFVKGWFEDSLPKLDVQFSLIRLDGDMYGSTWIALESLYPRLSKGGYCIIDDYTLARARWAMEEYREKNNITEKLIPVDCSVYWQKQ